MSSTVKFDEDERFEDAPSDVVQGLDAKSFLDTRVIAKEGTAVTVDIDDGSQTSTVMDSSQRGRKSCKPFKRGLSKGYSFFRRAFTITNSILGSYALWVLILCLFGWSHEDPRLNHGPPSLRQREARDFSYKVTNIFLALSFLYGLCGRGFFESRTLARIFIILVLLDWALLLERSSGVFGLPEKIEGYFNYVLQCLKTHYWENACSRSVLDWVHGAYNCCTFYQGVWEEKVVDSCFEFNEGDLLRAKKMLSSAVKDWDVQRLVQKSQLPALESALNSSLSHVFSLRRRLRSDNCGRDLVFSVRLLSLSFSMVTDQGTIYLLQIFAFITQAIGCVAITLNGIIGVIEEDIVLEEKGEKGKRKVKKSAVKRTVKSGRITNV